MNIKSHKDFVAGLLFMGAGLSFAWGASAYTIGNGARMGTGYFPLVLGVLLAFLGGIIIFKALVVETVDGDKVGAIAWRPLACITAANVAFGVLVGGLPSIHLPPMGLIAGIYALTGICCWAGADFDPKEALLLATILASVGYFACTAVFAVHVPIWPTFVGV